MYNIGDEYHHLSGLLTFVVAGGSVELRLVRGGGDDLTITRYDDGAYQEALPANTYTFVATSGSPTVEVL